MSRGGSGSEGGGRRRRRLGVFEVGVKRLMCQGMSGSTEAMKRAIASSSSRPSFRPGMSSVVTSTQMPSVFMRRMESRTGSSRAPHVFVGLVAKGLEVDVGGVEGRLDRLQGLRGHVAVGHEGVDQAGLARQAGRVVRHTRKRSSAPCRCRRCSGSPG